MNRCSGILMPLSSLPSPYGIGSMGQAAYDFAEFLEASGQKVWQMLPLGPTGYGDSPYQSFSSFAGNPYYIDLDLLKKDGLLTDEEIRDCFWGENPRYADYGALYHARFKVLKAAYDKGKGSFFTEAEDFYKAHEDWLPDYTLFMSLKQHFNGEPWTAWPEDIRLRKQEALERYRSLLKDSCDFYAFLQFLFFKQFKMLKCIFREHNIRIMGDLPIYAAMDSADVWAAPSLFQLDEDHYPLAVAGVPPDYFSQDGQLWGNPLYKWEEHARDGYAWWLRRISGAAECFDIIRIDHFRGFDTYWSVPASAETARDGRWMDGPGMDLIRHIQEAFPHIDFVAEDLGEPKESLTRLLEDSGWPGMKVLSFAFDPYTPSIYLPHHHIPNSVCYTGTHDNLPVKAWWEDQEEAAKDYFARYTHMAENETPGAAMLRVGMASPANLFIAQMQDYLELGGDCFMNKPGTLSGNWRWRMLPGEAGKELSERIRELTRLYER